MSDILSRPQCVNMASDLLAAVLWANQKVFLENYHYLLPVFETQLKKKLVGPHPLNLKS